MTELKYNHITFLPSNTNRCGEGGLRVRGHVKNSSREWPLVTVVVASFNGEKRIEELIKSVTSQSYINKELIIIDGGSTDKTLDIIKKYEDRIDYWVSESDKGISDAFNKGVILANGDYINFQGVDDYLLSDNVLELMMQNLNPEIDMLVCGGIERIADTDEKKIIYKTRTKFLGKWSLLFRMSLPHQALFANRRFFECYGLFDSKNKFGMDYELLLRAYKEFPKVIMKKVYVSAWRNGGVGTDRTLEIYKEYLEIKKKNKVAPEWILLLIYSWTILKHYIKKNLK